LDREAETEIDRELHRLGELSRRFTVNVQDLVDTILYAFRDDLDKAVAYCKHKGSEDGPVMALAYAAAGRRISRTLERT
jgi:hypothetical protein